MKSQGISQHEQIADGLASVGYATIDHFLTAAEVKSILGLDEFKGERLAFKKAGVGHDKEINPTIRGDYIYWIDPRTAPEEIKTYLQKVSELIAYLNQSLFLSLKDWEIHLTFYPAGSHYKRHLDQFKSDDHRRLSVVCYLNQDWKEDDGGQLRLYLPEGSKDIYPLAGRMVCFRSDLLEHEVLPASRERVSLTGWLLDQFAEWSHL